MLQHASLSYALQYARGASGVVVLTEVHVFEAEKEATPRPGNIVRPDVQDRTAKVDQPVATTPMQAPAIFPPPPSMEKSDAAQQFTAMLDRARQDMPASETRDEGELVRSFRKALEYVQQLAQTQ
jgi:hypothetical protein